ncbi:MAG: ammonium transporter [Alcanivoracaceae bacterium]|nr:ammonium transporter [Alcanivoracaceae bacterium]
MEQSANLSYALNTFYLLMSGAFVMLMAAGFSMLEAGMVRSKNTVEILTKNIALYSIACLMYMLFGYHIMYPDGGNGLIPFVHLGFSADNDSIAVLGGGAAFSHMADFFFQLVFVATAMSIVSGVVAERMKLWSFLVFATIFCAVIYPIQGYWKWGEGFLHQLGFYDFAGSGVVHLAGAAAAVAAVILLGARLGKYGKNGQVRAIPGCNMPLATLGTFILWFGWFGFNGGSQLNIASITDANAVALVFVNTNMAAAAGVVAAMLASKFKFGKPDLTMALNGALAGLVAITADPLSPTPFVATLIGAVAGVLVFYAIMFIDKLKLDDPVGAISVHGINGIWGLLALTFSNPKTSFLIQLLGVTVIFAFVFICSFAVWYLLKKTVGIRVTEEEEMNGLDISECGLEAYPDFITKH